MVLFIDNYDDRMSDLYKLLTDEYCDITVVRSDDMTAEELVLTKAEAVIIGTGVGNAVDMENCLEAVRRFCGNIPVLGIGLGAEIVCMALGGSFCETNPPDKRHYNTGFDTTGGIFEGMPCIVSSADRVSISVSPIDLPAHLVITARDEYGRGLAFSHREYPVYGICIYPPSLGDEICMTILRNFLNIIK